MMVLCSTQESFQPYTLFKNQWFLQTAYFWVLYSIPFTYKDRIPLTISIHAVFQFGKLPKSSERISLKVSPKTHSSNSLPGLTIQKQNEKEFPDISSEVGISAKFEALLAFLLKDLTVTTCCMLIILLIFTVPNAPHFNILPELYSLSLYLNVLNLRLKFLITEADLSLVIFANVKEKLVFLCFD